MTIQARAACPWSVVSNPKFDMWSSIQDDAKTTTGDTLLPPPPKPYVHPMMRRSASSLSQKSLEVCTESLGSETGSDGCVSDFLDDCFSDSSSFTSSYSSSPCHSPAQSEVAHDEEDVEDEEGYDQEDQLVKKELLSVNYHCSIGRRSPTRSFPPPLPSISRRDGPCVQMRSHRRDGRLVLEAVPVPSQNYLHCRRTGGRLLLTFIEPTFEDVYPAVAAGTQEQEEEEGVRLLDDTEENQEEVIETGEDEEGVAAGVEPEDDVSDDDLADFIDGSREDRAQVVEEEEEAEEEVEVVDRGIVVEVNVSRQPQSLRGGLKVRRSSLVINKFIGGVDDEGDRLGSGFVEAGAIGAARVGGIAVAAAVTEEDAKNSSNKVVQPPQGQIPTHVLQPQRSSSQWSNAAAAAEASISSGTAAVAAEEVVGGWGSGGRRHVCPAPSQDSNRLLYFTSKNPMNRQALLHQVRRCGSDPQRPLFIREPCCIATS